MMVRYLSSYHWCILVIAWPVRSKSCGMEVGHYGRPCAGLKASFAGYIFPGQVGRGVPSFLCFSFERLFFFSKNALHADIPDLSATGVRVSRHRRVSQVLLRSLTLQCTCNVSSPWYAAWPPSFPPASSGPLRGGSWANAVSPMRYYFESAKTV
jgi:hypothetical protein